MKTQAISNQNFNGQAFYVTKTGEKIAGKEMELRLPSVYRTCKREVANILKDEPFDVFISRGDNPLHFNIKASDGEKSTDNNLVKLVKEEGYTEVNHYKNPSSFKYAILNSIENFKKGNL